MNCIRERRDVVATAAACVWLAACGGGGGGPPSGPPPAGPASALAQFASCDDLRAAIVEDARRKINLQASRLRTEGWIYARDVDLAGPPPAPGAPLPEGDAPVDFTETNVQVEGVDEADFVETDGRHLYLLNGSDLLVLDSFPPAATALRATLAIEGAPAGMFVADSRALVLSHVYDAGDLGGDDACHSIGLPLPVGGVAVDALVPCAAPFTKITLVDLTGEAPRVARELYLEGFYTAARRHGGRVRVVVQRGWGLPAGVPEPWASIWQDDVAPDSPEELARRVDAWEAAALAALAESSLDEWLPGQKERVGGELVEIPSRCEDTFVPPPSLAGDGATTIFALDMTEDAGDVRETLVVGGAVQVYANLDTLLMGQPDWSWYDAGEATDRTAVHVFSLPAESLETSYLGSGFVPGSPISQFSFDTSGGVVRVATTVTGREVSSPQAPPTASRITTARIVAGDLVVVGSTGDLAPGERIFSSRFLGDLAYLVTFRQVDPLFVVDLADPAAPRVLGEVELPGFSEYIHPLGADRLLTIGRDADADGRTRGVALRIFDVSDSGAPSLSHVQLLPGEGWSPAESDHLAFTYDARLGLLAVPYSRYDGPYRSSLVLVGVDPDAGFSLRGEIDHDGIGPQPCPLGPDGAEPCFSTAEMRRGLFIEDAVYSISTAAVVVSSLSDLATPLAEVVLPAPVVGPPVPLPLGE